MANAIISGNIDAPAVVRDTWSCLTCGTCYDRCPSAVTFPEFIRDLRELHGAWGIRGHQAHDGFFQSLMRTMTSPDLAIQHWDWLPNGIQRTRNPNCSFSAGVHPISIPSSDTISASKPAISLSTACGLLNFFDIHPSLLADERCCGHDLLWSGDRDNFLKLAALNVEAIEKLGIEEVVTACPECYRTLSRDYAEHGSQ